MSVSASFYGNRERGGVTLAVCKKCVWLRLDGRLSAADARRSLPALRQVSLQTLSACQLTNTTQYHSQSDANQCCVEQSTHKADTHNERVQQLVQPGATNA
jgi:hypothetical protein